MNEEELEKQIRMKKKLLSDYIRLREAYYIDDETICFVINVISLSQPDVIT